jgi:hypothetical protein
MVYLYDSCDQISDFCLNSNWERCDDTYLERTDGRQDGRTDRRTEGQTDRGKTVYSPPLRGAGVYLDMCCIVYITIQPYIMASRFRLCRDSNFQATNHQWAYLLKLDTRQDMFIDWSLTCNVISFSVMWWSIFSTYQSPVSLLFNIGYTPRDCVRLVNILNFLHRIGRWKIKDRYQTLFVVLWSLYYLSINPFGFWNFNDSVKGKKGGIWFQSG